MGTRVALVLRYVPAGFVEFGSVCDCAAIWINVYLDCAVSVPDIWYSCRYIRLRAQTDADIQVLQWIPILQLTLIPFRRLYLQYILTVPPIRRDIS